MALAGFVEPGETLEACVHREVQEESACASTICAMSARRAVPFPHSLMLAFIADYVDGDITPQPGEIRIRLLV